MKIAVIGSGISGLSAAWLLARGNEHSVTLFEAGSYFGGHTNTVDVTLDGVKYPVDTGFLVFNDWTYPQLIGMFEHLGVKTAQSDMSFSVSLGKDGRRGDFEWAGSDRLATTFAQPTNILRLSFWRMIREMLRFNKQASALAQSDAIPDMTLGEYLDRERFGREMRDWYLVPMAACIWSTPSQRIYDFPLRSFLTFCRNHGLLSVNDRPKWRTVVGGARNYVHRMLNDIHDRRLNTPVQRVTRLESGVTLEFENEGRPQSEAFDHVVFACHTNQALQMLADPTDSEREMLEGIPYQPNLAILHTDASFMPRRKLAWAAWNFHSDDLESEQARGIPVGLTYWLNRLQPLPFKETVLVTLNPAREPDPRKVIAEFGYEHPVFTPSAERSQAMLQTLQGQRNTWFAGAWTRYGFHEDGLMSGIAVAQALGVQVPWTPAVHGGLEAKTQAKMRA
jgi:uncharacterized protein